MGERRSVKVHVSTYPARGLTPRALLERFAPNEPAMIWESSARQFTNFGSTWHGGSRFSVLALRPSCVVRLSGDELSFARHGKSELRYTLAPDENPLPVLAEHLPFLATPYPLELPAGVELPPVCAGAFGFFGYDCGRRFERIRGAESRADEPDIFLLECPSLLVLDRERNEILVTSVPKLGDAPAWDDIHDFLRSGAPAKSAAAQSTPAKLELEEKYSREEFSRRVSLAKEFICAGDIFQVVLGNTFTSPEPCDPLAAFDELREKNPSPFHFLVRFGEDTLVGASPEVMLRGRKDSESGASTASMRLVAGTYPKGERLVDEARELGSDRKELAEHLMLVDHARNDLGRVSEIGGVEVKDLFSIESYADVHHIVSQVSGRLRPDENMLSALQSCFPIATLTGTPKIRAMEIIAELEGPSRGTFGGAVVALGVDGSIDSAVTIRSLITGPGGTKIRAGAGIVYDSVPEREYEECYWKARAVFAAAAAGRK